MVLINPWIDYQKGVEVQQTQFVNEIIVKYEGLLVKSGATEMYLHYGYGDLNDWSRVSTERMDRSPCGHWEKAIRMKESQAHFCFKDSANNWDNNHNFNWSVQYQ